MNEVNDEEMSKQAYYVVMTADLAASSKLPTEERRALQDKIIAVLEECNKRFAEHLIVPFGITGGDEFQGLLSTAATSYEIAQFWWHKLYPQAVRFGVGRGSLSTAIYETTASMDGECFHRSRSALEQAKKENLLLVYQTGNERLDKPLNLILLLVQAIQEDWKPLHYRRFWLYKELGDLQKVAKTEGTSKSGIGKSLKKAKYQRVLETEKVIDFLLSTL